MHIYIYIYKHLNFLIGLLWQCPLYIRHTNWIGSYHTIFSHYFCETWKNSYFRNILLSYNSMFLFVYSKDPSCQDINTKFHCYVSDPNCPPKQHTGEQSNQYTGVYVIIIIGFLLANIVGFIMIYLWRRRKRIASKIFFI